MAGLARSARSTTLISYVNRRTKQSAVEEGRGIEDYADSGASGSTDSNALAARFSKWKKLHSQRHDRHYYVDVKTGESTWKKPKDGHIVIKLDDVNGKKYYNTDFRAGSFFLHTCLYIYIYIYLYYRAIVIPRAGC